MATRRYQSVNQKGDSWKYSRRGKFRVDPMPESLVLLASRLCKAGPIQTYELARACGYRGNRSFLKALDLAGYKLGRVFEPRDKHWHWSSKEPLSIEELEEIQRLMRDEAKPMRMVADAMFKKYKREEYIDHNLMTRAIQRTGWETRQAILPKDDEEEEGIIGE